MNNILIFFGGYCGRGVPGKPLTMREEYGQLRTSAHAFNALSAEFTDRLGIDPALDNTGSNPAVGFALHFLRRRPNRRARLVVYGYSAGGFNGLRFCERLAGDGALHGRTVDLLITVDPCLQLLPGSESFSTQTPRGVLRHVNYFQITDAFRGRRMPGAAVNKLIGGSGAGFLEGLALQLDSSPHNGMPLYTLSDVQSEVRRCLHG